MNPVLLKPGSDHRSFVVLMGRPCGELRPGEYATGRTALAEAAFARLRGPVRPVRRRHRRGRGLAGRDQPAGGGLRQHGPGPGRRPARGRGRRHRPRRGACRDVRHAGAARAGRPGPDHGLGGQQVPWRRRFCEPGLDGSEARTGVPFRVCCPGCTTCGSTGRTPWPSRGGTARGPAATPCPWRSCACRGSPTPPMSTPSLRSRGRGAGDRGHRGVAAADLVVLPGSVDLTTWRGCGSGAWTSALDPGAARGPFSDLRGLPDARREIEDRSSRVRPGRGPGLLPVASRFSAEKVLGRPNGHWRGYLVHGVRDPPWNRRADRRGRCVLRRLQVGRSGEPCGTAPSRATASGAPG